MRKFYSLILFAVLLLTAPAYNCAQGIYNLENGQSKSVDDLSQAQIEKLVKQMEQQGISIEEAIAIARAKGANETQIAELRERIEDYQRDRASQNKKRDKKDNEKQKSEIDSLIFSKRNFDIPPQKSKIFGFDFFNTKNLNFASNINTPLSDDYLIGVGDNIQISIYGASQTDYSLQVQKNRAINIPNVGPVHIGGLTLAKAKTLIKARLSSIYNGMRGSTPNTFATISLGDTPGINVNVIGEAAQPGTYTLPATAMVFNALYMAGGPGENGSFREINIVRDGKIIANVDVYDYLVNGDTRANIQLRNNDVVLVKPYLNRIFMEGAFKRDGIFEAKKGETVADLIRYAGGFTTDAYNKQVSLTRNNSRTLSFLTVDADKYENTPTQNGDKIKAGDIVQLYENRVHLSGAVYRPGNYELTDGLTLRQLIQKAEGLKDDAFLERGIITRKSDDMQLQTLSFSVKNVLNGNENILLKREDKILISSIFDMRENRNVEIIGAVQIPGKFPYSEGMTVADLIFMAGGFQEKASVSNIEIARRLNYEEAKNTSENLIHTYTLSVDRNLKLSAKDKQMQLMPFDHVYVRTAPGFSQGQGTASISGEVKYAGSYGITTKKERLSDLIIRAGGTTPEAYLKGASLRRKYTLSEAEYQAKIDMARQDTTLNKEKIEIKKEIYKVVAINLKKIMKHPQSDEDLILTDGDQLFIPKQLQTVKISGAVLNPVAVTFSKKLSAKDYINLSGGFAQNAKKGRVYVLYPNGEAHATRSFLFRSYPKVVPGAEIIVPEKPERDGSKTQQWLGFGSGIAGIAASIAAIISVTK